MNNLQLAAVIYFISIITWLMVIFMAAGKEK